MSIPKVGIFFVVENQMVIDSVPWIRVSATRRRSGMGATLRLLGQPGTTDRAGASLQSVCLRCLSTRACRPCPVFPMCARAAACGVCPASGSSVHHAVAS